MKLIDLLVQELPKHGGWPEGVNFIAQDSDRTANSGKVYGYTKKPINCKDYWADSEAADAYGEWLFTADVIADDSKSSVVSRAEYEGDLAAFQQPEWNGEGLPPVGTEVEVMSPRLGWTKAKVTAITDNWIIAQYEDGIEFAGAHRTVGDDGSWVSDYEGLFRRLKTDKEVERELQREATVASLKETLVGTGYGLPDQAAGIVLDAIAQGKVSGVKLTD